MSSTTAAPKPAADAPAAGSAERSPHVRGTAEGSFAPGTFRPAPGRGRLVRMLWTHTRTEALLTLRHAEQALLTLIIPIALLVGLSWLHVGSLPEPRVNSVLPHILALAVMSTALTGQAIALGFDRRYGLIKRLCATALPRWTLVTGRVLAALLVVGLQTVILCGLAAALGWQPVLSGLLPALLFLVLGTLCMGALGVLIGGWLRAELVLAVANTVWFVLLLVGGLAVPADHLPTPVAILVNCLPSGALSHAMTSTLVHGQFPGWQPVAVLLAWGIGCGALASRTTRLT